MVNQNLVLVIISGGTCAVNKVIRSVKGLLSAFYPGQEGGRAIADVLFGNYNPSGKLPVTMPKDDDQLPAKDRDFRNIVFDGVGYRWFDSQGLTPEFAFGHGLSYTTFEYRRLRVTPTVAAPGKAIMIEADIVNTGARQGGEVAQLYLSSTHPGSGVPMPVKQLRGFSKVSLDPGEIATVKFTLMPEELYIYDVDRRRYTVLPGTYTVRVGGSSDRLPLKADFVIRGVMEKPDLLVSTIRTVPPFPNPGDDVVFLASVLNRGTGPYRAPGGARLSFSVNGREFARVQFFLR